MINVISLGAGVQSSTMALMAAHGEITPMPDCAIFADTQWEPDAVYEWLDWLEPQLPFPVHRVSKGSLRDHIAYVSAVRHFSHVPFFTSSGGMGKRQCTKNYKLVPLFRKTRELLGPGQPKPGAVSMWIGISADEAQRMKPAHQQYIHNRWPLIERNMTRFHCIEWMAAHGYARPPKSACLGCPYHDDKQWVALRDNSPAEWQETVALDRLIRDGGTKGAKQFMHRSRVPLDQVDFRPVENQSDLFGNECEGMCGV